MRKVNSPYFNSAFYTITFSHVYKVSQPTAGETSAVISLCYVTSISSSSCSELRCDYGWICEHHEWLGVIWKMRILANIWIYSITTETHRLLLLRNACRLAVILVFLFKEELHHALPFFPPSYLDSLVILKIHSHQWRKHPVTSSPSYDVIRRPDFSSWFLQWMHSEMDFSLHMRTAPMFHDLSISGGFRLEREEEEKYHERW